MRNGQQNQFWRVNQQIRAGQLRVIGSDGKQIGILTREEAFAKAQQEGLDLVEIAPHANPPVVKIIDYTKFRYEQEKKSREERRKEKKGTTLKEVWFRPLIAEGDYQTRLERVNEFLTNGAKVRVTVKPKRRLDNTLPLYRVIKRVITDLAEIARVEQEPKMLGKQLIALLTPYKGSKKQDGQETKIETQNQEVDPSKV